MATGMCKDCFQGSIHEGETKGHVTKIHDFDTYVSHPPNPTSPSPAIIVLIPDGMGWASPNMRLTADRYALRTGCTVYLPDFMAGYQMPAWVMSFPLEEIVGNWTSPSALFWKSYYIFWMMTVMIPFRRTCDYPKSHPRVVKFFKELRKNEGKDKLVGVAGYCWGGKHAFLLGGDRDAETGEYLNLIDYAFTGHPSTVKLPEEVEALQVPMSVAMGTEDFMNNMEFSNKMKDSLEKLEGKAKGSELVFYEGGNHGFACRADLKNEKLRECAERAEDHFVRWTEEMVRRLGPGTSS